MYVVCICYVGLLEASTYIMEEQILLVKNKKLQQLDRAKNLRLMYHLSNDMINEIIKNK